MSQQKRRRKAGRPPLPKGDAKVGTLRVRVTPDELRAIEAAAKSNKQTLSELIRNAVGGDVDEWTVLRNGKKVTFTYREIGRKAAEMTAKVQGEEFTRLLKKTGLTLPIQHEDVENLFARLFPKGEQ